MREKERGITLSLIIDEVKTGELHGLSRWSYIPFGAMTTLVLVTEESRLYGIYCRSIKL